ncbi:complex I assembly factor ACAD9, mitochondrial [Diorhabda sublineata]|uniref:complex I assembly factor ACAD9, mitochondrial n=1 Tax=Diorhabda sublineata TaxID=1163346 RepID=UPI0024E107E6|nr:complex I assembly factor ACAD9, mitochondrial [Diorhabda sublineata]
MFIRPSLSNNFLLKRIIWSDLISSSGTSQKFSQQVPAVKNSEEYYEKQLKEFQTLTNVTKKVRTKKPQKPPFVKNFLLGKFDTDLLTYPELNKSDTKNLEDTAKLVQNLMKQNHMVDCSSMTKQFRQNLSDFKAIGLQAAQLMNGMECNITESSVFLEKLSEHKLRNSIVNNEQLGVYLLNKFGNDELKLKYLTKLMNGEILSAACISETTATDLNSLQTNAKLSPDGKQWILNGEKTCVVNGKLADIYIVFAVTKIIKKDLLTETKLTSFIIDKDSPGIVIKEIDCKGIEIVNITFNDTPIPTSNVIGEVNKAQNLLQSLITELRLSIGPMCVTVSKQILNNLITEIRNKSDDKNLLHETDGIREKIGEMIVSIYAMESILYLTTGLIDNYENQDIEVEASIVKAFCSDQTMKLATKALNLLGANFVRDSHWLHPLFEEALRFKSLNEPDDGLKIILALLCLQHAGKSTHELIEKIRNPVSHISFGFRRMWRNRRNNEDNPKLDLELGDYLHPSLENPSKQLEYCVKRLEFASEVLLVRYGGDIVNYHMELRRLANVIVDTYVTAACLGRASRSYCIGVQHGDVEMLMASTYANSAAERVKYNVLKIYGGYYNTNDENHRFLAKKIFKFKEYFPKHPLTRNF